MNYSPLIHQYLPFLTGLMSQGDEEPEPGDDSDYEPSDEESDDDYDESEVVVEDLSHLDPDAVIHLTI